MQAGAAPPQTTTLAAHALVWSTATPAAWARQALSYVVPLQPQTCETVVEQMGAARIGAQLPAAPAVHSPMGGWQNSPVGQVTPLWPPQATPGVHAPACATETPAVWAKQALK